MELYKEESGEQGLSFVHMRKKRMLNRKSLHIISGLYVFLLEHWDNKNNEKDNRRINIRNSDREQ